MKAYVYICSLILSAGLMAGCSDVGFDSLPKLSCDDVSRDQDTVCRNNENTITVTFNFRVGDVDILFVNDNSGSMYAEQQKMANAFSDFLGRISNLFYQIAIVTTDVSKSPGNTAKREANGYGAFQDGKFLKFTYDDSARTQTAYDFIDRNTPDAESLFRGTIQRKESQVCDANGYNESFCPSGDERGIYAANLAIQRGHKKFFRSGAHLAIVILSDEDERGRGHQSISGPMEPLDLPETLVTNLNTYYKTKSVSVHSIVTESTACLSAQTQTSQGRVTRGYIGNTYMQLSNPSHDLMQLGNILTGSVGSICAPNYTSQMSDIGQYIQNNTLNAPKKLACVPRPQDIRIITNPAGYESQVQYTIDAQNRIYFSNLPLGVQVSFSHDCPRYY